MPRWLRAVVTGFAFAVFFGGSALFGAIAFPLLRLRAKDREDHRTRITYLLHRCQRVFAWFMRWMRINRAPIDVALPRGVDPKKPYVMITNHPSLIDAVFLLGWFEGLTCVTKGSWYGSFVLGPLIRQSHYLPGPGSGADDSEDMLSAMVAHLGKGHPLLVFPEGTRSQRDRLNRFRRGAVEAAIRAKVPIVPLFIDVDRPYLMKGVPFYRVPKEAAQFRVEAFDVIDTMPLTVDDAKRVNAELQARYQARFARMLAERAEDRIPLPAETRAAA
jgi:1-acyl-sn-glycerol-3-phosphate acyltransferase